MYVCVSQKTASHACVVKKGCILILNICANRGRGEPQKYD